MGGSGAYDKTELGDNTPENCVSPHKEAISFSNIEEHLKQWLYYLCLVLQHQQLDYGVCVTKKARDTMFNCTKLLTVDIPGALKEYDHPCFVFSNADLFHVDDCNTHRCFFQPRHISVAMDKCGFSLPYQHYFGGISIVGIFFGPLTNSQIKRLRRLVIINAQS